MSEEFNFEEALEFKLNEGALLQLLKMVREGDITDDKVIEKNAKKLGYTLEKIKMMAFESHDFTKAEKDNDEYKKEGNIPD